MTTERSSPVSEDRPAPARAPGTGRASRSTLLGVLEAYALMYFPLQIDLDAKGNVLRIRMGDAALAKRP